MKKKDPAIQSEIDQVNRQIHILDEMKSTIEQITQSLEALEEEKRKLESKFPSKQAMLDFFMKGLSPKEKTEVLEEAKKEEAELLKLMELPGSFNDLNPKKKALGKGGSSKKNKKFI